MQKMRCSVVVADLLPLLSSSHTAGHLFVARLLLVLLLVTLNHKALAGDGQCKDINGVSHETGNHYVPGPEPCTLCVCNNGNPTWCKTVYCKYKDPDYLSHRSCKNFKFGDICCEVICLDEVSNEKSDGTNILDNNAGLSLGLRLVASCIIALLSLALLIFLIHRLRQRKLRAGEQNHQLADDQRSVSSMVYLDRHTVSNGVPIDHMPCSAGYQLWKSPSSYFPQGEAPPPYEEAVAAARNDQMLLLRQHASPSNSSANYLTVHNPTNISLIANSQNGLPSSTPVLTHINPTCSSPLISASNRPLSSPAAHSYYEYNPNEAVASDYCSGACSSSYGTEANVYENLPIAAHRSPLSSNNPSIAPKHASHISKQLMLPTNQNAPPVQNYHQHTTLPRQSTAYTISSSIPNTSVGSHRTIPRSLANGSGGGGGGGSSSSRLPREESSSVHQSVAAPIFEKLADHSDNTQSKANNNRSPRSMLPVSIVPSSISSALTSCEAAVSTNTYYNSSSIAKTSYTLSKAVEPKSSSQTLASLNFKPPLASANQVNEEGSFDSVTCSCNNGQAAAPTISTIHDDDYRSECENCKSASASRYYAGNEDELVASPRETMTLQRRPAAADAEAHHPNNSTCQYYRTCHTLPTNTKQQQRTRSNSSRENWFSSVPRSSTESSEAQQHRRIRLQ
ncbi:uncharacterized protein LOC106657273 isoform X2 [Trichogramma pretiosum]|uniref:uncharacterized protein LOC106657273 isoform X2 n=1 Tax=Trichogramma pretiosum TaxID=7493 RepID=UPI0006C9E24E|nr:uncharacterized protein LOC106657273 isoform X2 [Trichogramma pretiosum]